MDLSGRRYVRFEDLEEYCYRVASVVGLACIHIWGFSGPEALEPAKRCGIAFQLTNILRDLKEDAARDRIYLPLEDLDRFEYSEADLKRGAIGVDFDRLIAFEASRTEKYYAAASQLEPLLDRDGRRVFRAMTATYQSLLKKIIRHPAAIFAHRVRLGAFEKVRIAATSIWSRSDRESRATTLETVAR